MSEGQIHSRGRMDNNERLKLIVGALRLSRSDVARAVSAGGIETSNSKADSWLRSKGSTKRGTGGSVAGSTQRRDREMTDEEFDAFCVGLKPLFDEISDD